MIKLRTVLFCIVVAIVEISALKVSAQQNYDQRARNALNRLHHTSSVGIPLTYWGRFGIDVPIGSYSSSTYSGHTTDSGTFSLNGGSLDIGFFTENLGFGSMFGISYIKKVLIADILGYIDASAQVDSDWSLFIRAFGGAFVVQEDCSPTIGIRMGLRYNTKYTVEPWIGISYIGFDRRRPDTIILNIGFSLALTGKGP